MLKVPLRELLDFTTAKQSYKEAIGYATNIFLTRLNDFFLEIIPKEVNSWPDIDSLDF